MPNSPTMQFENFPAGRQTESCTLQGMVRQSLKRPEQLFGVLLGDPGAVVTDPEQPTIRSFLRGNGNLRRCLAVLNCVAYEVLKHLYRLLTIHAYLRQRWTDDDRLPIADEVADVFLGRDDELAGVADVDLTRLAGVEPGININRIDQPRQSLGRKANSLEMVFSLSLK